MISVRKPEPRLAFTADQEASSRQKRGRLTIFFGMAPGVGKTYTMLQAAREEAQAGREVVIGFVQTHGSKVVAALSKCIDQIPGSAEALNIEANLEMDLDALLARQPHLAVVDELAHTNPPGSRHLNRYQDVQELLGAGMDVFTTLDLQDIASEADKLKRIIGLTVGTTVPDSVLDGAEIKLVDISPEKLLKRLRVEMAYLTQDSVLSALDFFSESNLMTLRELSWRLITDHLDHETQDYMQQRQIHGPWRSGPRLLALVSPGVASEQIVRWTRRLADSLNSQWLVLYVETPRALDESKHARIARALALAEELGAEVVTTTDDDVVQAVLRIASQRNATQIVVGKSWISVWRIFGKDSFLKRLIQASGDLEIHIVPAKPEQPERRAWPSRSIKDIALWQYAISIGVVAAITLVTFFFSSAIGGPYAGALIYLLGVVVLGSFVRRGPTFMAATLSALLWNFLVLPPVFAFRISHVQDALLLGTYFIVALILGQLTTQIRAQQQAERLREERATALYLLTRELNEATTLEQIVRQAIRSMESTFKAQVRILYSESPDKLQQLPDAADVTTSFDLDHQAAAWVLKHGECAGKFTPNLPKAESFYAPLSTAGGVMGVVALRLTQTFPPTIHQLNLLDSFSQQIAFALDRHLLREVSERAKLLAESERLSKTLLNSMSHEMRTPIAVINSAVNNLLHLNEYDDAETRSDIMTAIQDATGRLNRLVGNLLNVARLESGHVKPRLAECDVGELIRVALTNTEVELANHPVTVDVAPDLPFTQMDFHLMEQAITNLLSNAAVHTAPGTLVEIRARSERQSLVVEVADRGPGIQIESLGRLFDKFYRGPLAPTGGTGLGLSLVKGFVEAQGGTVQAINRTGAGAVFRIRIPLVNVHSLPMEAAV